MEAYRCGLQVSLGIFWRYGYMHLLYASQDHHVQVFAIVRQGIVHVRGVLDLLLVDVSHYVARLQATTGMEMGKILT